MCPTWRRHQKCSGLSVAAPSGCSTRTRCEPTAITSVRLHEGRRVEADPCLRVHEVRCSDGTDLACAPQCDSSNRRHCRSRRMVPSNCPMQTGSKKRWLLHLERISSVAELGGSRRVSLQTMEPTPVCGNRSGSSRETHAGGDGGSWSPFAAKSLILNAKTLGASPALCRAPVTPPHLNSLRRRGQSLGAAAPVAGCRQPPPSSVRGVNEGRDRRIDRPDSKQ